MVGPEPQRVEGIVLHKEDPGSCPSHAGASPMTMRGQRVQRVRTQASGRKFKERAKVRCNGQGAGPPWMAKTKWAVSRDQRPQSSPLLSTLIRSHLKWRGVATEDRKLRGCLLVSKETGAGPVVTRTHTQPSAAPDGKAHSPLLGRHPWPPPLIHPGFSAPESSARRRVHRCHCCPQRSNRIEHSLHFG